MLVVADHGLERFFRLMAQDYDVRVPVRLQDGTRTLGKSDDGALSLCGAPLLRKITAVFFPQFEPIMTVEGDSVEMQALTAKPLLVAGWTAADLDCLAFIDKFFGSYYRDSVYFDKRQDAVVIAVSGWCGSNGDLQPIAGGGCDLELTRMDGSYIVQPYSDAGRRLISAIPDGRECDDLALAGLAEESSRQFAADRELVQTASQLLLEGKVPEAYWQSVADRCIACTACNLACPTCTCFDVFDLARVDSRVQRWRLWDSCQLDGFAREASGYNPMGEERVRAHRRIHHKLAADVTRWGHITCYLCGRCDRVCPTGIGMMAVCREIVEKYRNDEA